MTKIRYEFIIHAEPTTEFIEKYKGCEMWNINKKMQEYTHKLVHNTVPNDLMGILSKCTNRIIDRCELGPIKQKKVYCVDKDFKLYVITIFYLSGCGYVFSGANDSDQNWYYKEECNSLLWYLNKKFDLPLPNYKEEMKFSNGTKVLSGSRVSAFKNFINIDNIVTSQKPGTDMRKLFTSEKFVLWWRKMLDLFNDDKDIYNILNGKTYCLVRDNSYIINLSTISCKLSYDELVNIVRTNMRMVNAVGFTKFMESKEFKKLDIPINFFRLKCITVKHNRSVEYIFVLKTEEDD